MRDIIGRIEAGEIDIIIGTQIVAKGHNFPLLATVGIEMLTILVAVPEKKVPNRAVERSR